MMPEDPYAYVEAALQAPPSPDYVPGPEHPPSPDFVSEPVYQELMPPEDDVLPAEEQPLPAAVSSTADSPGYITESDPEEDPEEDDKDPKEDPADYPTNRDNDDEEEEESSEDDADDKEEDEDKDEKEEEHLALADSVPPPTFRTTTRMSIRDHTPIPFPSAVEVDRLQSCYDPIESRVTIYFPSTTTTTTYCTSTYQGIYAMMRVAAPSTYCLVSPSGTPPSGTPPILPIQLPTSSPPFLLPSTDYREDVPEVTLPPRMRLCIALGPRYEIGECSSAPTARPTRGFRADYGFVGTMDAEIRRNLKSEIGYKITDI
ncbi:hypothetical protein Tco_1580034, partial [Tanacetum coccineum]